VSPRAQLVGICNHPLPALTDVCLGSAASRRSVNPSYPNATYGSYLWLPIPLRIGGWVEADEAELAVDSNMFDVSWLRWTGWQSVQQAVSCELASAIPCREPPPSTTAVNAIGNCTSCRRREWAWIRWNVVPTAIFIAALWMAQQRKCG